ncbi:hypothetical protein AN958_00581 [Leucoagaricus sp. SymC.cos]|nr:hypothetical protein AN958_00581 [Leucoagaricus sp. SymC.cos]
MSISKDLDIFESASSNYVEVAATVMPKRMVGVKHMLRPACRYFPVPMSLGWQEDPVDDDYPQKLLVKGLQLTDIESGATRTVNAPWMHALYTTMYEKHPSGVMEVKLKEVQFSKTFSWQHRALLCVLATQGILGFSAIGRRQFRGGTLVLLRILLQILEGYFAWKFPTYLEPRSVARGRTYVLHKGMTTTHFLLISYQPSPEKLLSEKPYINLEDAAVPLPIIRRGYKRLFETTFRSSLQLASMGLKLGCVLSHANGLLVPFTLLFGTIASEIVMMTHTPLPKISSIEPLELTRKGSTLLHMVTAICQRTGCVSIPFVESVLPDREGNHVDFQWIKKVLESKITIAAGVHPTHQTANDLFSTTLQRTTHRVSLPIGSD